MRTKPVSQLAANAAWSMRWRYSSSFDGNSPQNATSGDAARLAVSSAVASCETPGPHVVVATPGVRVTRAQPSAIPSPAPSWRTSSILTPPSLSSSCIQYMLPSPMMPKMCVTPSATKSAASLWYTFILSLLYSCDERYEYRGTGVECRGVCRLSNGFSPRPSILDPSSHPYAVALAQRSASRSVNSLVMRLTTSVAPDSTKEASRPEISTCASMGTTDEPGVCPATTLKVIAVFTRVPPWSSLPREDTCPIIAAPSSSSATLARKVTLAGPNFTFRAASYEPSSSRSPSLAPGMHSTTARGSDSTHHTIRGAAGTSTRSLISITMWPGDDRAPGRHCFCAFVAMNSYSVPNSRPKPPEELGVPTGWIQHGLLPVFCGRTVCDSVQSCQLFRLAVRRFVVL